MDVGGPTSAVAVNPKSNRAYVSMFTTLGNRLWALDGANAIVDSIGGGFHTGGMAVDTARNRVYVSASLCQVVFNQTAAFCSNTGESQMFALGGDSLGRFIDTIPRMSGGATGIAYNPVTDRIYVAVQSGSVDTVRVINAATFQVIDSIPVGSGATGVAVNPVTNRIYVTNQNDGTFRSKHPTPRQSRYDCGNDA